MNSDRSPRARLLDDDEDEQRTHSHHEQNEDEPAEEPIESMPDEGLFLWKAPCAWLAKANSLGIRVARVALVLISKSSLTIHGPFTTSHSDLAVWGARRDDVTMAIRALRANGLLQVLVPGRGHTCSRYQLLFAPQCMAEFEKQRSDRQAKVSAKKKRKEELRRARREQPADTDHDAPSTMNGEQDDDE